MDLARPHLEVETVDRPGGPEGLERPSDRHRRCCRSTVHRHLLAEGRGAARIESPTRWGDRGQDSDERTRPGISNSTPIEARTTIATLTLTEPRRRWTIRCPTLHGCRKPGRPIVHVVIRPSVVPTRREAMCGRPRCLAAIDTQEPESRANRGEDASGATARRYTVSSARTARDHRMTRVSASPAPTTISDIAATLVGCRPAAQVRIRRRRTGCP